MGAKQSVQGGQVDGRPRSNSVMESNLQPPGPTRRTASHIGAHRNHSNDRSSSDDDDEVILANAPSQPQTIHGSGLRISMRSPRAALLQAMSAPGPSSSRHGDRRAIPILRFIAGHDVECPVCHKRVPSDDVEVHLVMCFTRPQLAYNEEVLEESRGECSICLEDMETGQTVARLECLCIYHKTCLDEWFKRKNVCPQHPGDD
ncbi:hypothetical protein FO519_004137 [Halicephalobus sp. NKZ332]|nr:hypothetical protein FO519_004137 [Halicephalobus sp. NKZ332]